ncbi:MAG: rhodanese-like domain-containing protein [Defluviitaleaceae bacterium]|nr:rhodanese-like domain-containing protein [Defluviitaleaceae bacterium]
MIKKLVSVLFLILISLYGCSPDEPGEISAAFRNIDHEEAREMIDSSQAVIILDVRSIQEHSQRNIQNSLLLPVDEISYETAAEMLPDKDAVIIVYCASGNRSRRASQALVDLGYRNVYDMGGIEGWVD